MSRSLRSPLLLLVVGLAGLAWCLSDPYRARVAFFDLGQLSRPEEVGWPPESRPAWHSVDPPHVLAPFAAVAEDVAGEGDTRERAARLLAYVSGLGGSLDEAEQADLQISQSDDPAAIMEAVRERRYRGNCSHYSLIFHTLSLAAGIEARLVGFEGRRWLDARGHSLNEVYLPERGSWMLVDPLYHATFEEEAGTPLSALEIRDRLLGGRDGIRVILGEPRAKAQSPEEILGFYRRQIVRLVYVGATNVLERRENAYGSWLARTLRLEAWPRPARRAAENIFWSPDRRYLYADRPELRDRFVSWYVFRLSGGLFAIALVWAGARLVRRRRGEGAAV